MLSQTTCSSTCHITSYDEVSIRTADTTRTLRCNFTRAHETDTTTYTSNTKCTLWLLFIKAVKYRITTDLLHTKNHFTHSRIWCLFNYILFCRPCFTILSNSFHVVIYTMFMRYPWFMSVWHPFIRRKSLCMTMIVVMLMIVVVTMMIMTATVAMMFMIMVVTMLFTMIVFMGIFIFHIFTHLKPPRGLHRPTNKNKNIFYF